MDRLTRKREVEVSRSPPRSTVVLVRAHIRKGRQQRAIWGGRLAAQCPDQAQQERALPPEGTAEQRNIVMVTPGPKSCTLFASRREAPVLGHALLHPLDLRWICLCCPGHIEHSGQGSDERFRFARCRAWMSSRVARAGLCMVAIRFSNISTRSARVRPCMRCMRHSRSV
jgi:hypothetical protein